MYSLASFNWMHHPCFLRETETCLLLKSRERERERENGEKRMYMTARIPAKNPLDRNRVPAPTQSSQDSQDSTPDSTPFLHPSAGREIGC